MSLMDFRARVYWHGGLIFGLWSRAIVCPVAEYGTILMMRPGTTQAQFSKLDCIAIAQFVEPNYCVLHISYLLKGIVMLLLDISLLLCKIRILDGTCRKHLQIFYPAFLS